MRKCKHCNKLLPPEGFYWSKGKINGYKCRTCTKSDTRRYAVAINPKTGLSNRNTWYYKFRENNLDRMTRYRNTVREKVISHYSSGTMSCKCCGELEPKFLAIDHIIPAGRSYKGKSKSGEPRDGLGFLLWLKKNGFPEGYRILCHNCNLGRSINNGVCPHKSGGSNEIAG